MDSLLQRVKRRKTKVSLFKVDFEDIRQGEGRGQETRTREANMRQIVWNQDT